VIRERRERTKRWISSSVPESRWSTELALYSSADYYVNNLVSPVLFHEALQHVPDNAVVIEVAPHCLLQPVLKRALRGASAIVGLMDYRQLNNLTHLLTTVGKYEHQLSRATSHCKHVGHNNVNSKNVCECMKSVKHYFNNQSLPHDARIYRKKLIVLFAVTISNPSVIIRQ